MVVEGGVVFAATVVFLGFVRVMASCSGFCSYNQPGYNPRLLAAPVISNCRWINRWQLEVC